jgi:Predicted pPIWI-associating nuclease
MTKKVNKKIPKDSNIEKIIVAKPVTVEPYASVLGSILNLNFGYSSIGNSLQHLTNPILSNGLLGVASTIQTQFGYLNQISSSLPNLDHIIKQNTFLEPSRSVSLGLSNFSALNNVSYLSDWIVKNNQNYLKSHHFTNIASSLQQNIDIKTLVSFGIESNLAKATELAILSEKSLYKFGTIEIGNLVNLSAKHRDMITNSSMSVFNSYSNLINSFSINPITYAEVEPSLNKIAPVSVYTTSNFLESITIDEEFNEEDVKVKYEIQYENEFSLSSHLPLIDVGLFRMWQGAVQSLKSDNPEKSRHFITSIRELFTHVFHKLAPDEEINKWTSDSIHFANGKPTRKARMKYILRDVSSKPMEKMIEKEVEATLELINIFQQGTHSIQSNFMPNQLIAIKAKAETSLRFLLEIQFNINNKN